MQETQEVWVQSLGQEDPLEKEMATHSSILAWPVPWTEETGGLQPIGSQRVRHNWSMKHVHLSTFLNDLHDVYKFRVFFSSLTESHWAHLVLQSHEVTSWMGFIKDNESRIRALTAVDVMCLDSLWKLPQKTWAVSFHHRTNITQIMKMILYSRKSLGHGLISISSSAVLCSARSLSHVRLFETPWIVACQSPLSRGFSRQEHWNGLPFPPPEDLPDPGIKSMCFVSCIGKRLLYHWDTREALSLPSQI